MKRVFITLIAVILWGTSLAADWNPTERFGYDRPMSITTIVVQLMSFLGPAGELETMVEHGNVVLVYTSRPQKDDSVRRIKVRLELAEEVDGRYRVITQGEQYECQGGRGQQEFAAALCL